VSHVPERLYLALEVGDGRRRRDERRIMFGEEETKVIEPVDDLDDDEHKCCRRRGELLYSRRGSKATPPPATTTTTSDESDELTITSASQSTSRRSATAEDDDDGDDQFFFCEDCGRSTRGDLCLATSSSSPRHRRDDDAIDVEGARVQCEHCGTCVFFHDGDDAGFVRGVGRERIVREAATLSARAAPAKHLKPRVHPLATMNPLVWIDFLLPDHDDQDDVFVLCDDDLNY